MRNACSNVSGKDCPDEVPDGKEQAYNSEERMILVANGRELDLTVITL